MNQKNTNTVSKFLSLVLRHQPELIGIELDNEGWVDVATLINQVNAHGTPLDMALLEHVVETNSKKRRLRHSFMARPKNFSIRY